MAMILLFLCHSHYSLSAVFGDTVVVLKHARRRQWACIPAHKSLLLMQKLYDLPPRCFIRAWNTRPDDLVKPFQAIRD